VPEYHQVNRINNKAVPIRSNKEINGSEINGPFFFMSRITVNTIRASEKAIRGKVSNSLKTPTITISFPALE
jgi:hypothetical protein